MIHDIQLSEHFKLSEFVRSSTATARGIDNTPTLDVVSNMQQLCINVLEPLRMHVREPVTISSGYRSQELNKAVGGSNTSQHMKGEACDIHLADVKKLREWFAWLMDNTNFDQLILEKSSPASTHYWIHVSYRQDAPNRHQVLYLTKS